jgi:hypothetical protein
MRLWQAVDPGADRGPLLRGCDARGSGVGTQQAIESGMNVAQAVVRYQRLRKANS